MTKNISLAIGDLAKRTGMSVSAIRFYEEKGLIEPFRTAGRQRRYMRSDIRRLSFILIAQKLGLSLQDIGSELSKLPHSRAPTQQDWQNISHGIKQKLNQQITQLQRTRDRLDGCIGCGCLSLKKCQLYNPEDRVGLHGPGPQLILND